MSPSFTTQSPARGLRAPFGSGWKLLSRGAAFKVGLNALRNPRSGTNWMGTRTARAFRQTRAPARLSRPRRVMSWRSNQGNGLPAPAERCAENHQEPREGVAIALGAQRRSAEKSALINKGLPERMLR